MGLLRVTALERLQSCPDLSAGPWGLRLGVFLRPLYILGSVMLPSTNAYIGRVLVR